MSLSNRYADRGVSSGKEDVHQAIASLDKGLFPNAFCKIVPDALSGSPEHCLVMHADGAGTKSSLAYLYWRETGDLSVWRGIAQDAVVMNTDDLLCVGATGPILLSSTIGRNKHLIPAEVVKALIEGTESVLQDLRQAGMDIQTKEQIELMSMLKILPNMEIKNMIMPGVHATLKTGGRKSISWKSSLRVCGSVFYLKCDIFLCILYIHLYNAHKCFII